MKKSEEELDLSRAFAAPPASYGRKTRTTLNSLEEEPEVKKFSFSMALAMVCAFVLMSTAIAAGINGGFVNNDKVLSQNTDGANIQTISGEITAENDYAKLTVRKFERDDKYRYALVEIEPKGEIKLAYSRVRDYISDVASNIPDLYENGEIDEDQVRSILSVMGGEPMELADGDAQSIGIIGGADGPTAIFVASKPSEVAEPTEVELPEGEASQLEENSEVIGGADGSTEINIVDDSAEPTENSPIEAGMTAVPMDSENTEIQAAEENGAAEIIGGADGPTSIFINDDNKSYITDVKMMVNDEDFTLGVADVSESVEHAQGSIVLAIIAVGESKSADRMNISMSVGGNQLECGFNSRYDEENSITFELDGNGDATRSEDIKLSEVNVEGVSMVRDDAFTFVNVMYTAENSDMQVERGLTHCEMFTEGNELACVQYDVDRNVKNIINITKQTYYTTAEGKLYHVDPKCNGMSDAQEISLYDANTSGIMPCPTCVDSYMHGEIMQASLAGDGSDMDDTHTSRIYIKKDDDGAVTYFLCQMFASGAKDSESIDIYLRGADDNYNSVTYKITAE